jgi:hypothetical protein
VRCLFLLELRDRVHQAAPAGVHFKRAERTAAAI